MLKVPNNLKQRSIKIVNRAIVFLAGVFILADLFLFAQSSKVVKPIAVIPSIPVVIKDSTPLIKEKQETRIDSIVAVRTIDNVRDDVIELLKAKNDSLDYYRAIVNMSYIYQN